MRNILIDTNVYTQFKHNNNVIVEAFRRLDFIGIDVTVYAELLSGFRLGTKERKNREELENFLNNKRVHLLNHDQSTSEFYANIYEKLKKSGNPVPTNDMWIAAVAMQYGLALFTLDKHFKKIEGLLLKTDF